MEYALPPPGDRLGQFGAIALQPGDPRAGFGRLLGLMAAFPDPKRDLPVMAVATGRADVLQGLLELAS